MDADAPWPSGQRVRPAPLEKVAEAYRKIRNTFRFLLGNVTDYAPAVHAVALEQMLPVGFGQRGPPGRRRAVRIHRRVLVLPRAGRASLVQLDRYALHVLAAHLERVRAAYDAMAYNRIYADTVAFAANELSALYLDMVKDRVYADALNSRRRRSAQTAMFEVRPDAARPGTGRRPDGRGVCTAAALARPQILVALTRSVAPLVPLLAEEVWQHGQLDQPLDTWTDAATVRRVSCSLQRASSPWRRHLTHAACRTRETDDTHPAGGVAERRPGRRGRWDAGPPGARQRDP